MEDDNKTKEQLVIELTELRSQNDAQKKSVTGSISAELATEEARRYAESIVETVREPLLVLDANLKIISANRNFYRTFKVTPGETIGSFIYDLGNKQWDIPKLRELLEEVLPEKETFDDFEVTHDFQDIGHKIMLLNARQIHRKDIGAKMILLAIEDITERKEIEDGLEKTRKELEVTKISEDAAREYAENIINTVREPLIALDHDLRVVTASRSFYKVFKVTPEETVGQLMYDLGNKQWDIPKLRELLETILPQKATFDDYEVEHDFADIGRRVMLLNARQIQRTSGKERIILLAIEDITERKLAEGEVQALNQELEQHITELQVVNEELKTFSYAVSHDLKAPLVTIGGFSRRLLEKYGDSLDEKGQQYLKMINTSSIRMEELIRGLLSFFSSGREAVNFSSLKMEKMVWEVFNQLKGMCQNRTIRLHVETMPDLKGDEAMITQVIVNLLSNAIKYTRPREIAVIYVGGWTEAERNIYYVKDNGIGFLIEDADKLFNAFERLQRTEEFEGTGLGLAIVKRVIERHGGVVWAEGKIGEGATFNFTIPR